MEMHALLAEMNALLDKIKSGTASLGELEAFAAAAQQLNERAIILKYKAIEAKVYASSPQAITDDGNAATSSASSELKQETVHEETEEQQPAEETVLALEESTSSDEELSFDLFSMDEEPTFAAEPKTETTAEIVSNVEEEEENQTLSSEEIVDEPAPIAPIFQETPQAEIPTTEPATPSTSEPVSSPHPTFSAPSNEHPVLRKARTNDGSLQSRLLSVRLETLKNAFGLNERMQIVRELFGGDNELYNQVIDELDNLSEVDAARTKVSHFAHRYGWREDSELAIEFVQKVERRYA